MDQGIPGKHCVQTLCRVTRRIMCLSCKRTVSSWSLLPFHGHQCKLHVFQPVHVEYVSTEDQTESVIFHIFYLLNWVLFCAQDYFSIMMGKPQPSSGFWQTFLLTMPKVDRMSWTQCASTGDWVIALHSTDRYYLKVLRGSQKHAMGKMHPFDSYYSDF